MPINITFKNSPISINGVTKFASQGSISEEVEFQRIDELARFSVETERSSRPKGTFSATYYLNNDDSDVRSLTGITSVTGQVGVLGFYSGFMSSYSISVEPNNLIQATVNIDFYSVINRAMSSPDSPTGGAFFAHGGTSVASGLTFNTNMFSFTYDIKQTIAPTFLMGSLGFVGLERTDGTITCSLNGSGIGDAVQFSCPDSQEILLNLKTLCNGTLGSITETGLKIQSSNLSISNDQDAVGEVALIRYF